MSGKIASCPPAASRYTLAYRVSLHPRCAYLASCSLNLSPSPAHRRLSDLTSPPTNSPLETLTTHHPHPNMAYHTISVTYQGRKHSIRYWADGHGMVYPGYATSLVEVRRVVSKHFGVRAFDLFAVTDNKKRLIATEQHLLQQIKRLTKRSAVHLVAIERKHMVRDNKQAVSTLSRPVSARAATLPHSLPKQASAPAPVVALPPHKTAVAPAKKTKKVPQEVNRKVAVKTGERSPRTRITWVPVVTAQ